ncbi:MAG: AAA family ATPase [Flavobacteriales bacterium]|nr:MAG: AAA family ATPase [Flavobacteriales bacterium]
MYIKHLRIRNLRTFRDTELSFVHPGADWKQMGLPKPRQQNVNLLLGDNGSGKSSVLKAVALSALGPFVTEARLSTYRLVRRSSGRPSKHSPKEARVEGTFRLHEQDGVDKRGTEVISAPVIMQKGDIEPLRWSGEQEKLWEPIYSNEREAFFFVGYGATRRVEERERFDEGARSHRLPPRAQAVQSLFEDAYSLVPLGSWLPRVNAGRLAETRNILNRLLKGTGYSFDGKLEQGEYLFNNGVSKVPFMALSDGFRAFLGWVGDLLYHINRTCPSGKQLKGNKGIVMVDEIDLHLHPKWQMRVLPMLAKALPNIQFIVTSHSPLVVGSLEWMNIIKLRQMKGKVSKAERIETAVHGLDADQVLVTPFFDMDSTRVNVKETRMRALSQKASRGDRKAAVELIEEWSKGIEKVKA